MDCAHEPDAAGETPRVDVVIAVIISGRHVLICRRAAGGAFAGFWEFPGGKREPAETIAECLLREIREELAVRVEPFHALKSIDHDYPSGRIRLHPYVCHLIEGDPTPLASQALRWVEPRELTDYPFPPANERLIEEVIDYLAPYPCDPRLTISPTAEETSPDIAPLISSLEHPKLPPSGD